MEVSESQRQNSWGAGEPRGAASCGPENLEQKELRRCPGFSQEVQVSGALVSKFPDTSRGPPGNPELPNLRESAGLLRSAGFLVLWAFPTGPHGCSEPPPPAAGPGVLTARDGTHSPPPPTPGRAGRRGDATDRDLVRSHTVQCCGQHGETSYFLWGK